MSITSPSLNPYRMPMFVWWKFPSFPLCLPVTLIVFLSLCLAGVSWWSVCECVGVWERVCVWVSVCACVCVCARMWLCVRAGTCVFPALVSIWSRVWPEHIRGTMSELEQLRQEAEQLRNQIRVRQRFVCTCLFMLTCVCADATVCTSHVCHCLFTASCDSHSFRWDSDALAI